MSEADHEVIRAVLLRSGYAEGIAAHRNSGLQAAFEGWETFVTTDWTNWDIAEYDHDLGSRYWIQLVIEYACAETRQRITAQVKALDDLFKQQSRALRSPRFSREPLCLAHHPYFWETGSIHPEDNFI